jgi:hypothetical protein
LAREEVIWKQGQIGQVRHQRLLGLLGGFSKISRKSVISFGCNVVSGVEFLVPDISSFAKFLGKFAGARNRRVKSWFSIEISRKSRFFDFSQKSHRQATSDNENATFRIQKICVSKH